MNERLFSSIFFVFYLSLFQCFDFLWIINNSYCCVISRKDCTFERDCCFFFFFFFFRWFSIHKRQIFLFGFFFFPFSFSISPSSANNRHFFLAMEFYNVLVSVWDYMRIIISVLFTNADLLFIRSFSISHIYVCALYFR